jgi:Domain of unknown function (DUF4157)/Protein-glutamine gamma-glutamyltransferase
LGDVAMHDVRPAPQAPTTAAGLEHQADEFAAAMSRNAVASMRPVTPAHGVDALSGDETELVGDVVRSSGHPLDRASRSFFEPRFRHDFSRVRVHSDAHSSASALTLGALAYTSGEHIVFAPGRFEPGTPSGRLLLGHELTHVVQQTSAGPGAAGAIQRKVLVNHVERPPKDLHAFVKARKWKNAQLATAIVDDMAAATDPFDFADDSELEEEVQKRSSTVGHMEESQQTTEKVPGDKRSAFGYPFSGASALYGPRVNFAAREYWEPAVVDGYALRTDKLKNATLRKLPRSQRCTVYGDQCNDYGWKLSKQGVADPYVAISKLFVPQPAHKRSLLHCDYLVSLVNFLSLADAVGKTEFNKRIAAFGADKIVLKWNAFADLHAFTFERTPAGSVKVDSAGKATVIRGLASTQQVTPSSEADMVLGDHVVFFNHSAYDLLNAKIGNAWRLENAVLVSRNKGKDTFLGHGSGHKTADDMRAKLAEEFNDVEARAKALSVKADSADPKTQTAALTQMANDFPNVKKVGGTWKIQGFINLGGCRQSVDETLRKIRPDEVIGPRNPCDLTKMYRVERPIESAK